MIQTNPSNSDSSQSGIFSLKNIVSVLVVLGIVGILSFISTWNYPLFHSFSEMFSIVIAFAIFVLAWNSRRYIGSHYLLFIGIAYLFVAILDLFHIVTYYEMDIFPGIGANSATQLWVSARYLQALSLLIAPFFIQRKLNLFLMMPVYAVLTTLLVFTIIVWGIFPDAFIPGSGLTPFKIVSENIIVVLLLGAVWLLARKKQHFNSKILKYVIASIVVTILSEFAFTLYQDPTGTANIIGHLLKIGAYFLAYKAFVETSMVSPFDLLFRNLKQSETNLTSLNEKLVHEVEYRQRAEQLALQNEKKYRNLFSMMTEGFALNEIIFDENGEPCNYRILEVNDALYELTGRSDVPGKTVKDIFPDVSDTWIETCGLVATTGTSAHFETFISSLEKWFEVYVYSTEKTRFVTLFKNITEQKRAEREVEAVAKFPSENPNVVLRIDSDGTVMYSNSAGLPFLSFLGTGPGGVLPKVYFEYIQNTLRTNQRKTLEVDFNGQILSLVFAPVSGEGYVNIYASDITEQKKIEEALQVIQRDLKRAQQVSLLGSWRLDLDTRLMTCSDEAYRIFEIPMGTEISEKMLMEYVHPDEREHVEAEWASSLLGEVYEVDHRIVTPSGIKWVREITEIEFNDSGEPVSAFGTVQDITDIKKTEQMKDEFIGLISHELRTPLTIIIGSLRSSMSDGISREDMYELLDNAIDGAESLAAILENMLELSRYQANRLQLEFHPVNIPSVTETVIGRLQDLNVTQTFLVEIPEGIPEVKADPLRVERILYNLIENATKYSPESSEIMITSKVDGDFVVTEVLDHGEGIPPENMENLFELFRRFTSSPTKSGLGLGLVVCKRLVEAQGGWISVRPNGEKGSVFCFALPSYDSSGITENSSKP